MKQTLHYRACHLCEAICGLVIATDNEHNILSIKGDHDDPLSRGHICPKAVALQDIQDDPDRLRQPVKRVGTQWQSIGWDEAFAEIAEKMCQISDQHGVDAIGIYSGNPSVHNYGNLTHASLFLSHFRTRNRYSATSVDQLPHQLAAYLMYGHQLLIGIPDIDRCQYLLMLGANPMASNGSLMTVPGFPKRLKALQKRGGKLVVIDPRRSETAQVADAHHFINPGSDAAFLLALIHTLFDEALTHTDALSSFLDDVAEVRAAVSDFSPEAAATITGISAAVTRQIARDFSAASASACYGRMGVSVHEYGTLCHWAINMLNILVGQLDQPGGVMFTRPAIEMITGPQSRPGHFAKFSSRVRGLPEFSNELPVAALAEEILTPGEGQIKALVTIAGNPVLSTPNGGQVERALGSLDFMLSFDFYINESTCHADIILPPTTALEHDHYDMVFHSFAVRNTVRFNLPTLPKPEGALHDWEIFAALGAEIARFRGQKARTSMPPSEMIDLGLRNGPYAENGPHGEGLSLTLLASHPHGVDLGALKSALPERLQTPNKTIRCFPEELKSELQRASALLGARTTDNVQFPLRLIGRRHLRSNNSWMHNYHRLVKGKRRDALLVHPLDAAEAGVVDGDKVLLASRVSKLTIQVQLSVQMMPGTVSLPHGWGHHRKGIKMATAAEVPGVSANDLTDEHLLDGISGNAALNGVRVGIEKLSA